DDEVRIVCADMTTGNPSGSPFVSTIGGLEPEAMTGWAAYAGGVVWALREHGLPARGLNIAFAGEVPLGSGLSSSAALECSIALATCAAWGVPDTLALRRDLVSACVRAEQDVAGAPTGGMDQTVSLFGQAGHALLIDCASWQTTPVPWRLPDGVQLLVVDTRASHALVDGQYGSRRDECAAAARALGVGSLRDVCDDDVPDTLVDPMLRRRVRHVLTENNRVGTAVEALTDSDPARLGQTFAESHASMRDDFEISCPQLDAVVETAMSCAAYGARMTGGGFGGCAIVLADADRIPRIRIAVDHAFRERGWPEPGFLDAVASEGARRVTDPR
ncbi:MAG: galactokinase, partial [Micrococcales bacterium]